MSEPSAKLPQENDPAELLSRQTELLSRRIQQLKALLLASFTLACVGNGVWSLYQWRFTSDEWLAGHGH